MSRARDLGSGKTLVIAGLTAKPLVKLHQIIQPKLKLKLKNLKCPCS